MDVGLARFRSSILASLGLSLACGPTITLEDSSSSAGSGGSSADGTASHDGGTRSTTAPNPGTADGTADDGPPPTTVTATATADGSSSDDGPVPPSCDGLMPIFQVAGDGTEPTGWEMCNGRIHRAERFECLDPLPSGPECTLPDQACQVDADCVERPHGRCVQGFDFTFREVCGCSYGCATDDDCDPGYICACAGDTPGYPSETRCIPSSCVDDGSCGDGLCALVEVNDGCGVWHQAACTTPDDLCQSATDCTEAFELCVPQPEGYWGCTNFCCCGRPLLVEGRAVTAAVVERDDWTPCAPPTRFGGESIAALPDFVRGRIAEHWRQCAQLEHASVASFARFTLELMQLGAPPSLLADAQRAGLDEIDHARRCFALASGYAGVAVGPGPLDVSGAAPATTLEAVVQAVIDEACVGETLAAVEARVARAAAVDPRVRETLAVIEADELRHAQLGWRTLAWALDQVDADTRGRLLARLDAAIDRAWHDRPAAMVDHDRRWLHAHGALDPAGRRDAWTAAIEQVLRPCAAALREQGRRLAGPIDAFARHCDGDAARFAAR